MTNPEFDGPVYEAAYDKIRLTGQVNRVFNAMKDGRWRTLREIHNLTTAPESSISAQLRHLRKPKFGAHLVNKQSRGARENGLWEYRLIVNKKPEVGKQTGLDFGNLSPVNNRYGGL